MKKQIIICSDGTWNEPNQKDRGKVMPSNVYRFARGLELENLANPDIDQRVFYDLGVGTGASGTG